VLGLVFLGLTMKAPIWYLPTRLSSFSGGDGWHRSYLIDRAYANLDNWWLAGMSFTNTSSWFSYTNAGTGVADITNQYLAYGFSSGLPAMLLFVALLVTAFRSVGRGLRATQADGSPGPDAHLLWAMGVALAMHCLNWFSISYFDQTYAVWYMQLAAVAVLSNAAVASAVKQEPEPEPAPVPEQVPAEDGQTVETSI
jgi:hypothetical protein